MAWGLALAGALAVVLTLPQLRVPAGPGQEVSLTLTRGSENSSAPHAVANRPLTLRVDVTELAAAPAFAMEIADSAGRSVWQGRAEVKEGRITQSTGVKPAAGQYWVRLYSDTAERQLLREFSLLVTE
jgi:hypothetical protein